MMMRETNPLMKPLTFDKQNPVYAKLVLLFLLLGVTIFLFSTRSIDFSPPTLQNEKSFGSDSQKTDNLNVSDTSEQVLENRTSPAVVSEETEISLVTSDEGSAPSNSTDQTHNNEAKPKCNLFKGDWVPNPSGPAYNNYTCKIIEGHQNCITNGRPDTGYLFWRWKPDDCELPKLNPMKFLEFMRNKYFAFVGDSIARNHIQSMLCMLSQVESPQEIYHDEEFRSITWIFPSYNFTIARVWAPFLLKAETFEDSNGVSTADIQLHVDKLDENWTKQYQNFDYVIISGGQWYMKTAIYNENNKPIGCHYCPGKNLTDVGFDVVYRKALNLVFSFMTSSPHKPRVLFRTIAPSHFEGGDWHTGSCWRKVPWKQNEVSINNVDKILYDIQLQEFEAAVSKGSGLDLKLFDTTKLSLMRPDGHPGPYRHYYPFARDENAKVQNDCLHWCMPGPIDSWNDIMMEFLMQS